MFKKLFITKLAIAAAFLVATPSFAEEAATLKVQNGVTVKSGTPTLPTPPATEDKKEDAKTEAKPETKAPEKVFMKPIIDEKAMKKTSTAAPTTTKFVENKDEPKKEEAKKESPFRKSQDANAVETVKKPDPTPEVKAKKLEEKDNIAGDLKMLDRLKEDKDKPIESGVGESGLPIPRFVSLKSGEANARTGPGDTYPIRWVYQRKHLPVEITAEFKLWRRIKDVDGEQSWVHQALLSSNRYAILNRDAVANSKEDGAGSGTARFKKGVQVKVIECKPTYCEVEYGRIDGWVKKTDLWGVYAEEIFD